LPLLMRLYEAGTRRDLVASVRDEGLWRYDLAGHSAGSEARREFRIIERAEGGAPVGFLGHAPFLWSAVLAVHLYELAPGVSWLAPTPSVLRYLLATGEEYAARDGKEFGAFTFMLGTAHPVYDAIADRLPRERRPYAYYLRVPDLPGFVRHVAPALERRLAASPLAGHTGEITISFYRDGLRLAFDGGRLAAAEAWRPTVEDGGAAAFPELTFLQLLFGYRGLRELQHAFADCMVEADEPRALLGTLFPKAASDVWPVS
ncbi:MAG: GNAT family N-acetyltransferase, partial [Chloroflexota bacterium]|nr:GNAT family N-acetyltransferase [Chloroflexota bacterium]